MENTNSEQIILTASIATERIDERCFPAKACVNYGLVASIRGEIDAGLSLMGNQIDSEIEAEIQTRREELQSLCLACPVSALRSFGQAEDLSLSQAVDSQSLRDSLGRQATYKDLLKTARDLGLNIIGGGNHPFSIEGTDGRKFAVPAHPGSLSPRVISNARKFIGSYL